MIRKVWIIVAIALIATMLVACNDNKEKEIEKNENTEVIENTENNENEENTTKIEINKTASDYTMGEWNESTYTNEMLDVKLQLPSGWIRYSDQEIADLYSYVTDYFSADPETVKDAIENQSIFYLFVQNEETGSNVQLMTEAVDDSITADYYVQVVKAGLEEYTEFNYSDFKTGKATVMGREFSTMSCTANYSGVDLNQAYYCEKHGNLMVSIIVTDAGGDVNVNQLFVE